MMRLFLVLLFLPALAAAQTRAVAPGELELSVSVEETAHTPFVREMVLITIRGVYRRHITRETLIQPDLDGINWAQLGADKWRDERLDGEKVTILERRMALYPNTPGRITIGAFRQKLTLTDEGDDWFDHEIASEPVTFDVAPAPDGADWFFPARALRVSDQWSNAPDQLQPGEGVLRVVRVEAVGVTTEMIPPMPDLASPSAMIFPHPEKRLVELTPEGPVAYAYWRWTIRPSNDVSAIVEPISFDYFNTTERKGQKVTIGAQRIAYGDLTPGATAPDAASSPASLPSAQVAFAAAAVFAIGVGAGLWRRRLAPAKWPRWLRLFDPLARELRRAARRGRVGETRRAATALMRRDGVSDRRKDLLDGFDRSVFAAMKDGPDLGRFVRAFLRA